MTGLDVFLNAFNENWFEFHHPNRVKPAWVKVVDINKTYGDISAHTRVIFVYGKDKIGPSKRPLDKIKNIMYATGNLSYHKLFRNCTVVTDEDKLRELILIEAKLRLL